MNALRGTLIFIMFSKVLISNRGEIACRIIRTARRLGIGTVCVHSDFDRNSLAVRMSDESYHIGGSASSDSYLRGDRIIDVALSCGVDCVHPGYGFLSENADFAELVTSSGLTFIGPPSSAIRLMGMKDESKQLMRSCGIPVVPGYDNQNQSLNFLRREADKIGYPVFLKAVSGGGGKGMRRVDSPSDFADSLSSAKREALSSFGNDRVLVERYVTNPRHIEFQIFSDGDSVVHLFERDCSVQRRHQKVIEESPAVGLSESRRSEMGSVACAVARAVDYEGAGTVEFIVDSRTGEFWFMEMNTRLQVEHPVTEMVTGLDLVELQFLVASGGSLPFGQDDISMTGHSIEARLYAEDCRDGLFLPSTNKLVALDFPDSPKVRVDSGVEAGDEISPYYDPMIAKLIVHGSDRADALSLLSSALSQTMIVGPRTNVDFLGSLVSHPNFWGGKFDTGLVESNIDRLTSPRLPSPEIIARGVSELVALPSPPPKGSCDAWDILDSFQLCGEREIERHCLVDGVRHCFRLRLSGSRTCVEIDGSWIEAHPQKIKKISAWRDGDLVYVLDSGTQFVFCDYWFSGSDDSSDSGDGVVIVPMHGRVISVCVNTGDTVTKGDSLFSVEAMKMEHNILAPCSGVVLVVSVSVGSQVESGFVALVLGDSE